MTVSGIIGRMSDCLGNIVGGVSIPLLLNLEFSDISGPLAQFQAKKVEKTGLGEVIHSINQSADQSVPEDRAKQLFTALWPEFEKQVESIPDEAPTEKHMRPQHEIIEELVSGVRGLDARFRELAEGVMEVQGPRSRRRRFRHFHPMMFEEMTHIVSEEGDDLNEAFEKAIQRILRESET